MLQERITNPWMLFKLVANPESQSTLAKAAFLHVIRTMSSGDGEQKDSRLAEIVQNCPVALQIISDAEMRLAFELFQTREKCGSSGQLVPAELRWIRQYVRNQNFQLRMESMIFGWLLSAPHARWNGIRKGTEWNISRDVQQGLAAEVLFDPHAPFSRKQELALEFDLPIKAATEAHFFHLVRLGLQSEADALGIRELPRESVIAVTVELLNDGKFGKAEEFVRQYLPNSPQLLAEVRQLREALMD